MDTLNDLFQNHGPPRAGPGPSSSSTGYYNSNSDPDYNPYASQSSSATNSGGAGPPYSYYPSERGGGLSNMVQDLDYNPYIQQQTATQQQLQGSSSTSMSNMNKSSQDNILDSYIPNQLDNVNSQQQTAAKSKKAEVISIPFKGTGGGGFNKDSFEPSSILRDDDIALPLPKNNIDHTVHNESKIHDISLGPGYQPGSNSGSNNNNNQSNTESATEKDKDKDKDGASKVTKRPFLKRGARNPVSTQPNFIQEAAAKAETVQSKVKDAKMKQESQQQQGSSSSSGSGQQGSGQGGKRPPFNFGFGDSDDDGGMPNVVVAAKRKPAPKAKRLSNNNTTGVNRYGSQKAFNSTLNSTLNQKVENLNTSDLSKSDMDIANHDVTGNSNTNHLNGISDSDLNDLNHNNNINLDSTDNLNLDSDSHIGSAVPGPITDYVTRHFKGRVAGTTTNSTSNDYDSYHGASDVNSATGGGKYADIHKDRYTTSISQQQLGQASAGAAAVSQSEIDAIRLQEKAKCDKDLQEFKSKLTAQNQERMKKLESTIEYFKLENEKLKKSTQSQQSELDAERRAIVSRFDEEQEKLRRERGKLNQERERHRQSVDKEKKDLAQNETLQKELEKTKKDYREKEQSFRNQIRRLQSQLENQEKEVQNSTKDIEYAERRLAEITENIDYYKRENERLVEENKKLKREKEMVELRIKEDNKIEKVVRESVQQQSGTGLGASNSINSANQIQTQQPSGPVLGILNSSKLQTSPTPGPTGSLLNTNVSSMRLNLTQTKTQQISQQAQNNLNGSSSQSLSAGPGGSQFQAPYAGPNAPNLNNLSTPNKKVPTQQNQNHSMSNSNSNSHSHSHSNSVSQSQSVIATPTPAQTGGPVTNSNGITTAPPTTGLTTSSSMSIPALDLEEEILATLPKIDKAPTSENGDMSQPISERHSSDGRIERVYEDQRREILFTNGLRKILWNDGRCTVLFTNGDIKDCLGDGTVVYRQVDYEPF